MMKYYKTMSHDKNKNRIEERVYSVTMTEEELKLFSKYLSEDILWAAIEQNNLDPKNKKKAKDLTDSGKKLLNELEAHEVHRLSSKYIKDINPKLLKFKHSKDSEDDGIIHYNQIHDMILNEEDLDKSGYDEQYSSKKTEKKLANKITPSIAKKIVDSRYNLAKDYGYNEYDYDENFTPKKIKSKNIFQKVSRKRKDKKLIKSEISKDKDLKKVIDGNMSEDSYKRKYGYKPYYNKNI